MRKGKVGKGKEKNVIKLNKNSCLLFTIIFITVCHSHNNNKRVKEK